MVFMRVDLPRPVWPGTECVVSWSVRVSLRRAQRLRHASCRCYIPTQMTLNWKPRFSSFFSIWLVMLSKPTWLLGKTDCCGVFIVAAVAIAVC